jgi:hypothetical protein
MDVKTGNISSLIAGEVDPELAEAVTKAISAGLTVRQGAVLTSMGVTPQLVFMEMCCMAFSRGDMIDPVEFPRLIKIMSGGEDDSEKPLQTIDGYKIPPQLKARMLAELRQCMFPADRLANIPSPSSPKTVPTLTRGS